MMSVLLGMKKHAQLLAGAPIAIAAVAALHTAPAIAQDAPTIVLDVPEPTSTATPIVLPEPEPSASPVATTSAPAASQPVTATEAAAEEPAPAAKEPAPARTAPAPRQATPVDTRNEAAAPATAPEPLAAESAEIAASETNVPPATTADNLAVDDAQMQMNQDELARVPNPIGDVSGAALLLALLGVGGIGLAAFFLMRSRRRRNAVPVIEKPIVDSATPAVDREPKALAFSEEPVMSDATVSTDPALATPMVASNGAAVELPAEVPANPRERGSLLRRMIEARPDRANPFRSHKARAKRARLILQSIGTRYTNRKPGIDLSQYTNIWPELRGWRPATA